MSLSDAAQKDLAQLAHQRVEEAINSVTQLLEDDDQILLLTMSVLTTMAHSVAYHMHEMRMRPDGKGPSHQECYCRMLSMLAAVEGVNSSVLSEEEAREAGLIK